MSTGMRFDWTEDSGERLGHRPVLIGRSSDMHVEINVHDDFYDYTIQYHGETIADGTLVCEESVAKEALEALSIVLLGS